MRIARDELRRIRELTRTIDELERELATLVAQLAPQLLAERGCGALTAAKLIGEIAGVDRFASDAQARALRRIAPRSPPPPANRPPPARPRRQPPAQLRAAPPRRSTRAACDPETAAYLAHKQAEGKTTREALRCLKRHLARRVWQLMQPEPIRPLPAVPSPLPAVNPDAPGSPQHPVRPFPLMS